MTALIDLGSYLREVAAFAHLADAFLDKSSSHRLREVEADLQRDVDAGRPCFVWKTRAPITFRESKKYDGPTKNHRSTQFDLTFTCTFERGERAPKRCSTWHLVDSSSRVDLRREGGGSLTVHFDYKNLGQWGPQMHFQVHEDQEHAKGGLPIPRIMTAAFLPTDCADLMLSELHHDSWPQRQHQRSSLADVAQLRKGQENRTLAYLADIKAQWATSKFTRFTMLQDYTASLALPDASNRVPKKEW